MGQFTVGRALVLLFLGVGIGVVFFVTQHLSPEALDREVRDALDDFIQAEFRHGEISIDLDSGVVIPGLVIDYPDGTPALEVERVVLTVDTRQLLSATVDVRQVDLAGVVLRLRPDEDLGGAPGLPGILRELDEEEQKGPPIQPVVHIGPGKGGSRIELSKWDFLGEEVTLQLDCLDLEANFTDDHWTISAEFGGQRVAQLKVDLTLDPAEETFDVHLSAKGLSWRPEDLDQLARRYRRGLPPIEFSGDADLDIRSNGRLDDIRGADTLGVARVRGLNGRFGNLLTGERAGLPFRLKNGTCMARFEQGVLSVPDLSATYISPAGDEGRFNVMVKIDLLDPSGDTEFALTGTGLRATTQDLRLLLEREVVESIVDPFMPAGGFDFHVRVLRASGRPEKVWANVDMRDCTFNYAGTFDELTGKRFGFHYPLERCSGKVRVETNVPSTRGLTQVSVLEGLRGYRPIENPVPGGPTEVSVLANGKVTVYKEHSDPSREDLEIDIEVRDLPIDNRLAAAFSSTPGGVPYAAFDLKGWADPVQIRVVRDGFADNLPRASFRVHLKDCEAAYRLFPIPLHNAHGYIVSTDVAPDADGTRWREFRVEKIEADIDGGGKLKVEGGLIRQSDRGGESRKIHAMATDVVLGESVRKALRAVPGTGDSVLELWDLLHPKGKVDATISLLSHEQVRVDVDFAGKSMLGGYRDIECPVTDLQGHVAHTGRAVELIDVRGKLGDSTLRLDGLLYPDKTFEVNSSVRALVLDRPVVRLIKRLSPEATPLLDSLKLGPESKVDIAMHILRRTPEQPVVVRGEVDDIAVETVFRDVPVKIRGGPMTLLEEEIQVEDLWLETGDAQVHVLTASLPRGESRHGSVSIDATNLHPVEHLTPLLTEGFQQVMGDNMRVDLKDFTVEFNRHDGTIICSGAADLRRAEMRDARAAVLEPTGALGFAPLTLRLPQGPDDPFRFSGVIDFRGLNMNLQLDASDMSGQLMVADGVLSKDFAFKGAIFGGKVTVMKRVIEEINCNIEFEPNYLSMENIDARFYVGDFKGGIHVHLADPGAFKLNLKATGVDLAEMLEEELPREGGFGGTVDASIEIESRSGELRDMTGHGEIKVREGQLFKLPILRTILSIVSRVAPLGGDAPRFKHAQVIFDIEGETFQVRKFHLGTNSNDVYGYGTVTLYGDMNLVVEPQVTKYIDLPRLINIPVLSTLRNLLHRTVYQIRMEGTIDSPALRLRGLPFLRREHKPFTQSTHAGRVQRIRPSILP